MVRYGFKKISLDIDEALLLEIDDMKPQNRQYHINRVIEEYLRIKGMAAKDALKAIGSKMTEEEKKIWGSL